MLLTTYIRLLARLHAVVGRARAADERGQASAEYALVLLGAAAIAGLLTTWVAHSNVVGRLLDTVYQHLLAQAR